MIPCGIENAANALIPERLSMRQRSIRDMSQHEQFCARDRVQVAQMAF
jgi:hypothetical protein